MTLMTYRQVSLSDSGTTSSGVQRSCMESCNYSVLRLCALKCCVFGFGAYWVGEAEIKVVHTKVEKLFFLQRAADISANLLYDTNT